MIVQSSWLQRRIRDLGKTQRGLAKVLDVDPSQVSDLVNGRRRLQLDEVGPIAQFLEISKLEVLSRFGHDMTDDLVELPVLGAVEDDRVTRTTANVLAPRLLDGKRVLLL